MRYSFITIPACLAMATAIAGCGRSSTATVVQSPGALVTSHVSAQQMYRDMSRALHRVDSVSISARIVPSQGPVTIVTSEIQIPGRAQATVRSNGAVVNERFVGGDLYLRYNTTALLDLTDNEVVADLESGRWIKLSDSQVPFAASMQRMASHRLLQECDLLGDSGRLTVGRTSTTVGLPSVALRDHGGRPGTGRRQIIVSANPPYLPLQIIQRTPARPGGSAVKDCLLPRDRSLMHRLIQIGQAFDRRRHIRLRSYNQTISRYDQPLHLVAPPHPLTPRRSDEESANQVAV